MVPPPWMPCALHAGSPAGATSCHCTAAGENPAGRRVVLGYTPAPANLSGFVTIFQQGLQELGHVAGQTIRLEYRYAEYQWDPFPTLAAELVQLKPDVIVTGTLPGVLAAKQATTTIPIVVAAAGDLVEEGIVESLARPGGNITGQILPDVELAGKRLEMLKEAAPTITYTAILVNAGSPVAKTLSQRHREGGTRLRCAAATR